MNYSNFGFLRQGLMKLRLSLSSSDSPPPGCWIRHVPLNLTQGLFIFKYKNYIPNTRHSELSTVSLYSP